MDQARTVTATFVFVPLTITSLTADKAAPQVAGTDVTVAATVTGGIAPQACKWWVTSDNCMTYQLLQDWQACSTALTWTPTVPANYQVGVWARSSATTVGSPQVTKGLSYPITAPPPPSITSLTARSPSPPAAWRTAAQSCAAYRPSRDSAAAR